MTKSIDITMPSLGADMSEGMLVKWLINVGEYVHHGQAIAVLETQKGAIDMEVYYDGTITELLVQPIKTVPVGTVLAKLELNKELSKQPSEKLTIEQEQSEELSATDSHFSDKKTAEKVQPTNKSFAAKQQEPKLKNSNNLVSKTRVFASPVVRKIAKQKNIDLSAVSGSGANNAVLLKDIERCTENNTEHAAEPNFQKLPTQKVSEKKSPEQQQLTEMRAAIAAAMTKSKQHIPHFYLSKTIEVNKAQQWLEQINQDKSPKEHILLVAVLLKAVALTLNKYPELNGFYLNDHFEKADEINIANVISLRTGGVVVPSLQAVDTLSVSQIMAALQNVTARARAKEESGRLRSSELMNASITVTNMGDRGADNVFGVIYPPQVAIIGFGKVKKTPQVIDGELAIGFELTVSLSADHRVIDGILAGKFLNALAKRIQKPEQL